MINHQKSNEDGQQPKSNSDDSFEHCRAPWYHSAEA